MGNIIRVFLVFIGLSLSVSISAKTVYVAAASNLTFVLPELVKTYQQVHPETQFKLSFSSTRNLYQQVIRGAPFELFLSADKLSTDLLESQNLLIKPASVFTHSKLCFYSRKDSVLHSEKQLSDLFLSDSVRIALANPEVAPFGRAAKQSLVFAGIWDKAKQHIIQAENVAQAASYALSGNVDGALIACHFAYRPQFQTLGANFQVPVESYHPLEQSLAVLKSASLAAQAFGQFLLSPEAQVILVKQGYSVL